MRSVEKLLEENKYIGNYIENIKNGYFNVDNELANLECNWLESADMHGDGEYVVNIGDEIIMGGLTELESEELLDYLIGILQSFQEDDEEVDEDDEEVDEYYKPENIEKIPFKLGQAVMTISVQTYIVQSRGVSVLPEFWSFIDRHKNCDWGDLCQEDWLMNDEAVRNGDRILSVYHLSDGEKLYIITEWDRSVTTVLFPEDY